MKQLTIVIILLIVSLSNYGCNTTIIPPVGSEVRQREGVTEIIPRQIDPPAPEPVCLVRARFFRGMVGVPCAQIAQEVRP